MNKLILLAALPFLGACSATVQTPGTTTYVERPIATQAYVTTTPDINVTVRDGWGYYSHPYYGYGYHPYAARTVRWHDDVRWRAYYQQPHHNHHG